MDYFVSAEDTVYHHWQLELLIESFKLSNLADKLVIAVAQNDDDKPIDFTANLLRKVQLQIAVNDNFVEPTVNAIIKGGRTGKTGEIGDGKIFVLPMDDCIRIRTGERGNEAI